ncbi:hypothetical protein Anapl_00100 [Anas platyrhynchos]|uniref:Uncharacterized protein n=1 Tax=Anas platyrhynchos TaxID=8839 RepID=R0LTR4_ANAPL|nr:hypothetical protein Anapl_00100 [Anas platyrhynchos]
MKPFSHVPNASVHDVGQCLATTLSAILPVAGGETRTPVPGKGTSLAAGGARHRRAAALYSCELHYFLPFRVGRGGLSADFATRTRFIIVERLHHVTVLDSLSKLKRDFQRHQKHLQVSVQSQWSQAVFDTHVTNGAAPFSGAKGAFCKSNYATFESNLSVKSSYPEGFPLNSSSLYSLKAITCMCTGPMSCLLKETAKILIILQGKQKLSGRGVDLEAVFMNESGPPLLITRGKGCFLLRSKCFSLDFVGFVMDAPDLTIVQLYGEQFVCRLVQARKVVLGAKRGHDSPARLAFLESVWSSCGETGCLPKPAAPQPPAPCQDNSMRGPGGRECCQDSCQRLTSRQRRTSSVREDEAAGHHYQGQCFPAADLFSPAHYYILSLLARRTGIQLFVYFAPVAQK